MLVKCINRDLFVRDDEPIPAFVPAFTRIQIEKLSNIYSEEYSIRLGGGATGSYHSIDLPTGKSISISSNADTPFYGNYVDLVNNYLKTRSDTEEAKWLRQNLDALNIAVQYWRTVISHENAELNRLRANIQAIELNNLLAGKPRLTDNEVNMIVLEYGYDPEKSWNYR